MTAAIYSAYHKAAPTFSSRSVVPIHVGRAMANAPLSGMIGDDDGDNISSKNSSYCELTALYWAWKNTDPSVERIGLMHYRRLLDFSERMPANTVEQSPSHVDIPDWCAEVEDWLDGAGKDVDLVIPRLHLMGRSVEQNYQNGHRAQDFRIAREIVARDHPEILETFDTIAGQPNIRLGNMMLMRRDLLDRYCSWLFPILEEVEQRAPVVPTTPYQARYIGFLAERLLTIFVEHLIRSEADLKIKEVSILKLGDTLVTPYLSNDRLNGPEHVNIAFASDRTYLPHAAAMVQSVLDHADTSRQFNFFFLHADVGDLGRSMLREVINQAHPNAILHEINTGNAFATAHRSATRSPSNATYSRFLLFELLPGVRRLLYLDCDVIARADVTPLFDADLGGAEIGGVPDWIMTRTLTGPIPTADPNVPDLGAYQRNDLGMSDDDINEYFNAGVMLFDFEAMQDSVKTGADLIKMTETGRYLFRDQDILNAYFRGRKSCLDPRWNVFNSGNAAYDLVPKANHAKAMAAKRDPWIIHYADSAWKPWAPEAVPLSQHYWAALIKTPFFGEVAGQLATGRKLTATPSVMKSVAAQGQKLADAVPALRGPLLRIHAALGHPGRK